MKSQLYIKSVDSAFFNRPNLNLFISSVFNNFIDLYDYPQLNHNKNEIVRLVNSEKFHGYIVFFGNKIIGYLLGEIINYNGQNLFFINYIYVSPAFRNKKIGSQLINYSKDHVKINNLDGIGLIIDSENDKNMYFYKKLNFGLSEDRLFQRHELFVWKK
jgi:ribosomal protein S18 acetylase RimI-like enzyme